jgi:carboxylesterase
MPESPVLPDAEPFSAAGGPHGALVLHGFTGNPQSMRGLAQAFAATGYTVELPRLPGHGTSVADMATTRWSDWSAAADKAYEGLAGRCQTVVVAGLSMGGTLAVWLATRHPEIAGVIVINGLIEPFDPTLKAAFEQMRKEGSTTMPGVGSDLADPDAKELAYDEVPLDCLLLLLDGVEELQPHLSAVTSPVLIMNSPQDHVVPPTSSELLAKSVSGIVERLTLERSYHVATLDFDKELIEHRSIDFAEHLTEAGAA